MNNNRPFIVHLRCEHRQLNEAVERVEQAARRRATTLPAQLDGLQQQMLRHFAEEELDGCLQEAVARRPALAQAADAILAEHVGLLTTLSRLAADPGMGREPQWHDRLTNFIHALRDHEHREALLLEQGLNADQDVESFD